MCSLQHPNIARTFDVYRDEENYYVLMEFVEGKSLLDHIKTLPKITEKIVAGIMRELLLAVSFAHKNSIVHGNLSFSQVLCTPTKDSFTIKVVGFSGYEGMLDPLKLSPKDVIFYSPEKAAKKEPSVYGSDVWACGIICCALLSGLIPFTVKEYAEDTLEEIKACNITIDTFKEGPWKKVSLEAKQFLIRMLERDTQKRSSSGALLYDKWLSSATEGNVAAEQIKALYENMQKMKGASSMQNAILYYLAEKGKTSSLWSKAAPIFKEMDKAGTGKITKSQFALLLQKIGVNAAVNLEDAFAKLDLDGDGTLNYTELMTVFVGRELAKKEENLKFAFDSLDLDKSGDLTAAEIIMALGGKEKCGKLADKIVQELSGYKEKKINYSQFLELMQKLS